jgi:hypothetical protein
MAAVSISVKDEALLTENEAKGEAPGVFSYSPSTSLLEPLAKLPAATHFITNYGSGTQLSKPGLRVKEYVGPANDALSPSAISIRQNLVNLIDAYLTVLNVRSSFLYANDRLPAVYCIGPSVFNYETADLIKKLNKRKVSRLGLDSSFSAVEKAIATKLHLYLRQLAASATDLEQTNRVLIINVGENLAITLYDFTNDLARPGGKKLNVYTTGEPADTDTDRARDFLSFLGKTMNFFFYDKVKGLAEDEKYSLWEVKGDVTPDVITAQPGVTKETSTVAFLFLLTIKCQLFRKSQENAALDALFNAYFVNNNTNLLVRQLRASVYARAYVETAFGLDIIKAPGTAQARIALRAQRPLLENPEYTIREAVRIDRSLNVAYETIQKEYDASHLASAARSDGGTARIINVPTATETRADGVPSVAIPAATQITVTIPAAGALGETTKFTGVTAYDPIDQALGLKLGALFGSKWANLPSVGTVLGDFKTLAASWAKNEPGLQGTVVDDLQANGGIFPLYAPLAPPSMWNHPRVIAWMKADGPRRVFVKTQVEQLKRQYEKAGPSALPIATVAREICDAILAYIEESGKEVRPVGAAGARYRDDEIIKSAQASLAKYIEEKTVRTAYTNEVAKAEEMRKSLKERAFELMNLRFRLSLDATEPSPELELLGTVGSKDKETWEYLTKNYVRTQTEVAHFQLCLLALRYAYAGLVAAKVDIDAIANIKDLETDGAVDLDHKRFLGAFFEMLILAPAFPLVYDLEKFIVTQLFTRDKSQPTNPFKNGTIGIPIGWANKGRLNGKAKLPLYRIISETVTGNPPFSGDDNPNASPETPAFSYANELLNGLYAVTRKYGPGSLMEKLLGSARFTQLQGDAATIMAQTEQGTALLKGNKIAPRTDANSAASVVLNRVEKKGTVSNGIKNQVPSIFYEQAYAATFAPNPTGVDEIYNGWLNAALLSMVTNSIVVTFRTAVQQANDQPVVNSLATVNDNAPKAPSSAMVATKLNARQTGALREAFETQMRTLSRLFNSINPSFARLKVLRETDPRAKEALSRRIEANNARLERFYAEAGAQGEYSRLQRIRRIADEYVLRNTLIHKFVSTWQRALLVELFQEAGTFPDFSRRLTFSRERIAQLSGFYQKLATLPLALWTAKDSDEFLSEHDNSALEAELTAHILTGVQRADFIAHGVIGDCSLVGAVSVTLRALDPSAAFSAAGRAYFSALESLCGIIQEVLDEVRLTEIAEHSEVFGELNSVMADTQSLIQALKAPQQIVHNRDFSLDVGDIQKKLQRIRLALQAVYFFQSPALLHGPVASPVVPTEDSSLFFGLLTASKVTEAPPKPGLLTAIFGSLRSSAIDVSILDGDQFVIPILSASRIFPKEEKKPTETISVDSSLLVDQGCSPPGLTKIARAFITALFLAGAPNNAGAYQRYEEATTTIPFREIAQTALGRLMAESKTPKAFYETSIGKKGDDTFAQQLYDNVITAVALNPEATSSDIAISRALQQTFVRAIQDWQNSLISLFKTGHPAFASVNLMRASFMVLFTVKHSGHAPRLFVCSCGDSSISVISNPYVTDVRNLSQLDKNTEGTLSSALVSGYSMLRAVEEIRNLCNKIGSPDKRAEAEKQIREALAKLFSPEELATDLSGLARYPGWYATGKYGVLLDVLAKVVIAVGKKALSLTLKAELPKVIRVCYATTVQLQLPEQANQMAVDIATKLGGADGGTELELTESFLYNTGVQLFDDEKYGEKFTARVFFTYDDILAQIRARNEECLTEATAEERDKCWEKEALDMAAVNYVEQITTNATERLSIATARSRADIVGAKLSELWNETTDVEHEIEFSTFEGIRKLVDRLSVEMKEDKSGLKFVNTSKRLTYWIDANIIVRGKFDRALIDSSFTGQSYVARVAELQREAIQKVATDAEDTYANSGSNVFVRILDYLISTDNSGLITKVDACFYLQEVSSSTAAFSEEEAAYTLAFLSAFLESDPKIKVPFDKETPLGEDVVILLADAIENNAATDTLLLNSGNFKNHPNTTAAFEPKTDVLVNQLADLRLGKREFNYVAGQVVVRFSRSLKFSMEKGDLTSQTQFQKYVAQAIRLYSEKSAPVYALLDVIRGTASTAYLSVDTRFTREAAIINGGEEAADRFVTFALVDKRANGLLDSVPADTWLRPFTLLNLDNMRVAYQHLINGVIGRTHIAGQGPTDLIERYREYLQRVRQVCGVEAVPLGAGLLYLKYDDCRATHAQIRELAVSRGTPQRYADYLAQRYSSSDSKTLPIVPTNTALVVQSSYYSQYSDDTGYLLCTGAFKRYAPTSRVLSETRFVLRRAQTVWTLRAFGEYLLSKVADSKLFSDTIVMRLIDPEDETFIYLLTEDPLTIEAFNAIFKDGKKTHDIVALGNAFIESAAKFAQEELGSEDYEAWDGILHQRLRAMVEGSRISYYNGLIKQDIAPPSEAGDYLDNEPLVVGMNADEIEAAVTAGDKDTFLFQVFSALTATGEAYEATQAYVQRAMEEIASGKAMVKATEMLKSSRRHHQKKTVPPPGTHHPYNNGHMFRTYAAFKPRLSKRLKY